MTDLPSLQTALTSIKAASDILKGLRSTDTAYEKADLKLKVAELAELLADARVSVLDTQEEMRGLHARIQELEAAQDVRDRLVMRGNLYFVKEGDAERGPYCVACFEKEGRLMP